MTKQGAEALEKELKQLWKHERPEVVKAITAAAAEGDRSENAEYIYRKKQLAGIDRRVRYLSKRLDQIQVVEGIPEDQSKVRFGAWVDLENETGETHRYRVVGADETDARKGFISVDSPLARAVLGKACGEDCLVSLPEGEQRFHIKGIRYVNPIAAPDEPAA